VSLKTYVITDIVLSRLKGRGIVVICDRCDVAIVAGDLVVFKRTRSSKFYHKACYDKMFVAVD
jgi:hypothetical protein